MTKRISSFDAILLLIVAYSFTTLTQSLYPFSMNRLLILFLAMVMIFERTMKKSKIILLLYLSVVLIVSCMQTNNLQKELTDFIYFAVAIIQLHFLSQKVTWDSMIKSYIKFEKIVRFIAYLDFAIITLTLLYPGCYVQHWGEGVYLYGFTESGHAMGASCCLAMALLVLVFSQKKFSIVQIVMLAVVVGAVLRTGARVFLIPVAILLYYFLQNQVNNKKIRWVVYILGALVFVYAFMRSSMMEKFLYTIADPYHNSSTLMQSLTSGRSRFWVIDLNDYIKSGFFQILFGHGFSYIYQLNLRMVGMEIWAHNDFINIIVACGAVGLIVYIISLSSVLKEISRWNTRIVGVTLGIYVLFPAIINGFYTYYHFFSSFFVFALITAVKNFRREQRYVK